MTETTDVVEEIAALEDRRYAAMVAKDVATLDELLDEKLIYMHSSGVADTKASYLKGLQTGVWDYHQVDRSDLRTEIDGDVALVFGKLSIRITIRGEYKAFDSRALAVWHRRGGTWHLLAVQSGAMPATR
jgi:ketosteroid isomerase-like protein